GRRGERHENKTLPPHPPGWDVAEGGGLGRAAPPPIEEDQPTEGGKSAVEGGFRSHVPLQIELAEAVVVDEVERAFADDLVGYLGFANSHISRLRRVHSKQPRRLVQPRRRQCPAQLSLHWLPRPLARIVLKAVSIVLSSLYRRSLSLSANRKRQSRLWKFQVVEQLHAALGFDDYSITSGRGQITGRSAKQAGSPQRSGSVRPWSP